MEYLIIIFLLIIMLIVLFFIYDINLKKMKQFVEKEEGKLNVLTQKYPSNIEICKYILNKIDNKKVTVVDDENIDTCLYIALTDKIIIANVRDSYTRIQTIAHECLHSIQSRKVLIFNFIYSNIYIISFSVITILSIVNIIPRNMIFIIITLTLSYIYYFIRSYLEDDAMIKACFLAKEYMEDMKLSEKKEIDEIINSYEKLNDMGIKTTNFCLMFETIVRVIIVAVAIYI